MSLADTPTATPFVDRRSHADSQTAASRERRQFGNHYDDLSPEARELAIIIDEYKVRHHRRFITYEELLTAIQSLGYHK